MAETIQVVDGIPRSLAPDEIGRDSREAAPFHVVRLVGSNCANELSSHRDQWLQSLKASDYASTELHPDLLFAQNDSPSHGLTIFANWPTAAGEQNAILAVLAPKRVSLRMLAKPALQVVFRGHRVVGNEVIGCTSSAQLSHVVRAILQLLAERESECILIESLAIGSPLHQAILAVVAGDARFVIHWPSKPQPHWWIDFPSNPGDYWKKFSKKTRDTLRAKTKKFPHEFLCFTTQDDVPRFFQRAHEISKRSWQSKRMGLRIVNSVKMREHWQRVAKLGAFRAYAMEQDGRPIAFILGRQWNGMFTYEETGYDLEFARLSPGTILQSRVIEDLIFRDSPRSFDFSFGDGAHKRLFGNRQTESAAMLLVRRGWRNSAIFAVHGAATNAVERIRSTGLYKRLRRSYHE